MFGNIPLILSGLQPKLAQLFPICKRNSVLSVPSHSFPTAQSLCDPILVYPLLHKSFFSPCHTTFRPSKTLYFQLPYGTQCIAGTLFLFGFPSCRSLSPLPPLYIGTVWSFLCLQTDSHLCCSCSTDIQYEDWPLLLTSQSIHVHTMVSHQDEQGSKFQNRKLQKPWKQKKKQQQKKKF